MNRNSNTHTISTSNKAEWQQLASETARLVGDNASFLRKANTTEAWTDRNNKLIGSWNNAKDNGWVEEENVDLEFLRVG